MHHGREEELVLQQLRQPLATLVELILPHVLIRDADTDRVTPMKVRGTDLEKQRAVTVTLTWPMSLTHAFISDSFWREEEQR